MNKQNSGKLGLGKLDNQVDRVLGSETIIDIDISMLREFPEHPFKPYPKEKMDALKKSIREVGILSPILVMRGENTGEFTIISGHNRVEAAKQLGMQKVPAAIKTVDVDTAAIMMVDTNFNQRDAILPSEKAFAYKMKRDAIGQQGKRTDLTSPHCAEKLNLREEMAKGLGESEDTILRYIRLTKLNDRLLAKVDNGKLGFIPAVDLSFLTSKEQKMLVEILEVEKVKPTKTQAQELKKRSQKSELTQVEMLEILTGKKNENAYASWNAHKRFKEMLPSDLQKSITAKRADEILEQAMVLWAKEYR